SLLIIINLGEVVSGTITSISAVVTEKGWTAQAGLVTLGGVALALGLWWVYFTLPWGHLLARRWRRAFVWGTATWHCSAAWLPPGPACRWPLRSRTAPPPCPSRARC